MKRILCFCLAWMLVFGMFAGCSGQTAGETPSETAAPAPDPVAEAVTEPAAEPALPAIEYAEGLLMLTVSEISFSLVGENEDIYCGTVPRESITWETEDESVASWDNGRLIAAGVGETIVRAVCGEQSVGCRVSCLANTSEELALLSDEILRSPKRIPTVVEGYNPRPFFSDAAFLGDSITWMMYQHEMLNETLGHPTFLCRGGVSLNGFVKRFKNLYYQGNEAYIEDVVAGSGAKKLFIMLGQNDLGYMTEEETLENYESMLILIREKCPDIEFYIQTCLPEWCQVYESNSKNEKIDVFNKMLVKFTEDHNCHLVYLDPYFEDHTNRMATVYTADYSIHMNELGSEHWMTVLANYAYLQQLEDMK